jgi:hypothetical protein
VVLKRVLIPYDQYLRLLKYLSVRPRTPFLHFPVMPWKQLKHFSPNESISPTEAFEAITFRAEQMGPAWIWRAQVEFDIVFEEDEDK